MIAYVLSGLACALAAATFVVLLVRNRPSSAVDLDALLKRQRHADAVAPPAAAAPTARGRPPVAEPPAPRPTRSREAEDESRAAPPPPPGPARGPDSGPAEPTSEPEAPPAPAGLATPADPASGSQPPPAAASRKRPSSGTPARDAARAAGRAAGTRKEVPTARSATPPKRDAATTDMPGGPRRKATLASAQAQAQTAAREASPPSAGREQAPAAKRRKSAAPSSSASGDVGTRRAAPRTPARENAAICQVHWLGRGRGSCFSAVTVDAHGAKHSLATSRRVEWRGSMPPAETPDSQAALRQLSKILRDKGWQPMRGNGEDFGQERWYARRFREVPARAAPGGAGTSASRPPRTKDADGPG